MSYRVEYTWDLKWEKAKSCWGPRLVVLSGVFFALFLILVNLYWQEGREVLWRLIFPGGAETAWSALEGLAGELQQGVPLRFATEEFCREIIQSGY